MDLHNVRTQLKRTLAIRQMSQGEFAEKYGVSASWLNKFINEHITNSRINTLKRIQDGIDAEVLKGN